nr:MAG TPA: hypothetical protein [Caudoviricetes sp.]
MISCTSCSVSPFCWDSSTAPAGFKHLVPLELLNLSYPVSRCSVVVLLSLSVLPSTFAVVVFP